MNKSTFGEHILIDYDHGCSGEFLTKEIANILGIDMPHYVLNGRTKVKDPLYQLLLKVRPDPELILADYDQIKYQRIVAPAHRHANTYFQLTSHPRLKVIRVRTPVKYRNHAVRCVRNKIWYSSLGSPLELMGFLEDSGIDFREIKNLTHRNCVIEFYRQHWLNESLETIEKILAKNLLDYYKSTFILDSTIPSIEIEYDDLMFDDIENSVNAIGKFLGCDASSLIDAIKHRVEEDKK